MHHEPWRPGLPGRRADGEAEAGNNQRHGPKCNCPTQGGTASQSIYSRASPLKHLKYKVRPAIHRAVAELQSVLRPGSKVYIVPRRRRSAVIVAIVDARVRDLTRAVADITGVCYSTYRGTITRPQRGLADSTPIIDTLGFALYGAPVLTPVWVQRFEPK